MIDTFNTKFKPAKRSSSPSLEIGIRCVENNDAGIKPIKPTEPSGWKGTHHQENGEHPSNPADNLHDDDETLLQHEEVGGMAPSNSTSDTVSMRLDRAELLCSDDKILAAAHLLRGIDECQFRPVHRYIVQEAEIFNRLLASRSDVTHSDSDNNRNDQTGTAKHGNNTNECDEIPWIKQGEYTHPHKFSLSYKLEHLSNADNASFARLTCRIQTLLPPSLLLPLLSVLNESELYSTWIPHYSVPRMKVLQSEKLRQSGRCTQIIRVVTEVPWPLKRRELILKAVACDFINPIEGAHGCGNEGGDNGGKILVRIQSLDCHDNPYLQETEDGLQLPPVPKGSVRIDVEGGFIFEKCPEDHPLKESKSDNISMASPSNNESTPPSISNEAASSTPTTLDSNTKHSFTHNEMPQKETMANNNPKKEEMILLTFTFSVDPKLPIIPQSFINFFLRTAMGQMWSMFLKVAEDVKDGKRPEHSGAIGKKRELYDWVEERTDVMLRGGLGVNE